MNQEVEFIKAMVTAYSRSSQQENSVFDSDAEIIKTKNGYLISSLDTVSEEIHMGLVRDPQSLAWLTMTASLSDLAAVGRFTDHVQIFVSDSTANPKIDKKKFRNGCLKAQEFYRIPKIDIVEFESAQPLTSCLAVAESKTPPTMSRRNLYPGDHLFLTGPIGWGNAVGFANLALRKHAESMVEALDENYRPLARTHESQLIQKFSRCCIDTSDGLLMTLDLLMQLNSVGVDFKYGQQLFHPVALQVSQMARVNPWLFLAGQNGEFELLFAISPEKMPEFMKAAKNQNFSFLELGTVTTPIELGLVKNEQRQVLDISPTRNILQEGIDPQNYILALMNFAESNRI